MAAEIVFIEPRVRDEVVFTAGEAVSYGRVTEVVESVLRARVGVGCGGARRGIEKVSG